MMYAQLCTEFYDIDKKFADQEEINFYTQFIKKTDLILEPMCGSGRLLIPLMQQGYNIHGVDNSPSMLKSCRERAAALGLQPTLFEQAIEKMSLPQQYDIILIPFGSFQLLYPRSEAMNVLQIFKKHLKPGGKLILDLYVPWDALYENHEEEFTEKSIKTPDGGIVKHGSRNTTNKYEQYCFSDSFYQKIVNDKIIAEEKEQMHLCWYYRYEMELIFEKYGFKLIAYQEKHFTKETHMIFVVQNY